MRSTSCFELFVLFGEVVDHPLLGFLFGLALFTGLEPAISHLLLIAHVGQGRFGLLQELGLFIGVDVIGRFDRDPGAFHQ